MIAYNKESLDHLFIHKDVEEAFEQNCISKEERDAINKKFPATFYTPNIFIRIGLFIVTLIIMLFSFGLMALIFWSSNDYAIGGLSIFFSIMAYSALEFMVQANKHYRSGVDDGLLWGSALALVAGIIFPNNFSQLTNFIIVFIVALYFSIRFTNALMAVITFLSLLAILFYYCIALGSTAKAFVPFVIMAASMIIYFLSRKLRSQKKMMNYSGCLDMIIIASLISFYAAGNYFVVRELSNSMFHMNLQPGQTIPFGWLFWIFTLVTPLIYLFRGIQKKDTILIRVGMLLVAAIVFTIRYYHTVLPVETMMTLGGIVLLLIGYGLMKYLHEPKFGFTYMELSNKNSLDKLNIESLVIAQTFSAGTHNDDTKFGGGSFGGGGATGEY